MKTVEIPFYRLVFALEILSAFNDNCKGLFWTNGQIALLLAGRCCNIQKIRPDAAEYYADCLPHPRYQVVKLKVRSKIEYNFFIAFAGRSRLDQIYLRPDDFIPVPKPPQ